MHYMDRKMIDRLEGRTKRAQSPGEIDDFYDSFARAPRLHLHWPRTFTRAIASAIASKATSAVEFARRLCDARPQWRAIAKDRP